MKSNTNPWLNCRVFVLGLGFAALMALIVVEQSNARTRPIRSKANSSRSADSTRNLQNAVHRLNAWLSGSSKSLNWRKTLLLNVLDTQSALGEQADVSTLWSIHQRFAQGYQGLDHPAFRDVRIALEQQIAQLSRGRVGDVFASLTMARGHYQPISVSTMEADRATAKYELQLLKKYYRQTMPSRKRADLFYDLQLAQVIAYLGEVKFEIAPEISVGKMTSMIREVQRQLNEVEAEIDAMPLVPEEDDDNDSQPDAEDDHQEEPSATESPVPDEGGRSVDDLQKAQEKLEARIDELKEQRLAIARSDRPRQLLRRQNLRQLGKFKTGFFNVRSKLGDPYFVSASASLDRFIQTYFHGTTDNLQEDFLKRLEDLETDLLAMSGLDARESAGRVGSHLRWMENANQVPDLVTSIRARYSNPNLYISVSARLINEFASQSVNDSRNLRETMDGRLVRGTLSTSAQVSVELQNDPNQIHASIHLTGNIDSSTYVEQRSIRAFASATGQLEGRRSIFANIGGLHASDPQVAANIQTFFNGTNSPFRFVNRIAAKKFEEVRFRTEGNSARKAEQQLRDQFGEQTDSPIANGIEALAKAQDRLVANTNLLPELYLRSFDNEIMVVGKKSSIATLAAQNIPLPSPIMTDISVRVHDSVLSNFLDRTFSGKTFTDKELASEIGSMFGQQPAALKDDGKPGDKNEPFSITFADVRPIQFEFEDNTIQVVVSGKSFAQANKPIDEGLKIILKFKIKSVAGKLKLVREGKAEIEYLGDKSPKTVGFRSILMGKLNPKEGGKSVSVDLPENLLPIDQIENLKNIEFAKRLKLIQCRIEGGWFYLGWNHQAANTYPNSVRDTPAIWTEAVIQGFQDPYLLGSHHENTPNQPQGANGLSIKSSLSN